jgi:hypothetical protein
MSQSCALTLLTLHTWHYPTRENRHPASLAARDRTMASTPISSCDDFPHRRQHVARSRQARPPASYSLEGLIKRLPNSSAGYHFPTDDEAVSGDHRGSGSPRSSDGSAQSLQTDESTHTSMHANRPTTSALWSERATAEAQDHGQIGNGPAMGAVERL